MLLPIVGAATYFFVVALVLGACRLAAREDHEVNVLLRELRLARRVRSAPHHVREE